MTRMCMWMHWKKKVREYLPQSFPENINVNLNWNGKSWHYLCLNQTLNLTCKNIFKIYLVGRIFLSVLLCFCPTLFVCMGGRPDSAKLWLNIGKCVMKIALSFSPTFQGMGVLEGFLGGLWARMEWGAPGLWSRTVRPFVICALEWGAKSKRLFVGPFVCLFARPAGGKIFRLWRLYNPHQLGNIEIRSSQVMHQTKSGGSQRKIGEGI